MILNEHQAVLSPRILLVPYSEHHVPTYHEWMQDEDLRKATASEPLTIDQEHAMQKSWREDADKLTFIVCQPPPASPDSTQIEKITQGNEDSPDAMFGDVNLFLYTDDDDDDESTEQESTEDAQAVLGEVEIMIARKDQQGKGLGREILIPFLWYVVHSCSTIMNQYHTGISSGKSKNTLKYLRVKIGAENARSVRLFESVGFKKISETPNYFGELELRWLIDEGALKRLVECLGAIPRVLEYA
ncbi:GNAT domain-containing protein [Lophiotrema nucula]|uniref:GNAT domain-containing protein n=1 Tax=Lophiotrema nucula TaxID=690887 RepID=A0A6A5YPL5_9PLEO|nr:GNAT domain-containing protein [Lophiotrema nucula]